MARYRNLSLFLFAVIFFLNTACGPKNKNFKPKSSPHDLNFSSLAKSWDEGIPLGNGVLGALIWQKESSLRIALDRIDLWDLRSQKEMHSPDHNFQKFYSFWKNGEYEKARELRDKLRRYPYPTKIPGGALEFALSSLGEPVSVHLYIQPAVCEIIWKNGTGLQIFVHATNEVGWFRFSGLPENISPVLVPPAYHEAGESTGIRDQNRGSLFRLEYPPPELTKGENFYSYHQETSLENSYDIQVQWRKKDPDVLEGAWTIFWNDSQKDTEYHAPSNTLLEREFNRDLAGHLKWWNNFWKRSEINVPDPVIMTHWYREMYKFGACTGTGSIPISLQSVWTADNGNLPPWAGDFHHDLNTQLSYWPAYTGNHLDEARIFVDWLWQVKPEAKKYTKTFFQSEGLAFPGVTDISGRAMGGWWQYSHNPSIAAWLAHHFYWQWRYSMDRIFLESRAYPWIKECAEFFMSFSDITVNEKRNLPLSSSPEINDDRPEAWFPLTTNFDLALIRWTFIKAAELALELRLYDEADLWNRQLLEWPELHMAEDDNRLLIAPGYPLKESHRHFSHLMAIHPLGLFDISKGEKNRKVIFNSLGELDRLGTQNWVGYSFSWLASLKARAGDGTGAAKALQIFAESFCSPNTFHLNGDQSGKGYSRYSYRPFTLEGNFAYAAGLMEMLIQSHNGLIRILPAVPLSWENLSFSDLRTEGAFLISAIKEGGKIIHVKIFSEKGGELKLQNPFADGAFAIKGVSQERITQRDKIIRIQTQAGDRIIFKKK